MISRAISLAAGWLLDLTLGDPAWLPHPVVGFGKLIAKGEKRWNNGTNRVRKGAFLAVGLVIGAFILTWCLLWIARALPSLIWGGKALMSDAAGSGSLQGAMRLGTWLEGIISAILIFFCLAGTTLIREVRHFGTLRARNPHRRARNPCRKPQRRRHSAAFLARDTRRARNGGLQDDKHPRLDDRVPQ